MVTLFSKIKYYIVVTKELMQNLKTLLTINLKIVLVSKNTRNVMDKPI